MLPARYDDDDVYIYIYIRDISEMMSVIIHQIFKNKPISPILICKNMMDTADLK